MEINKQEWEQVILERSEDGFNFLRRTKVAGGWLYQSAVLIFNPASTSNSLCFVPDVASSIPTPIADSLTDECLCGYPAIYIDSNKMERCCRCARIRGVNL